MEHRYPIIFVGLVLVLLSGCFGKQEIIKPPEGSSEQDGIPSYRDSKSLKLGEEDTANLLFDIFYITADFESNTLISWTEDAGNEVQSKLDETLPENNWRIDVDWQLMDDNLTIGSMWRKGDLGLVTGYIDNLDSEMINNFRRQYGITGLEPGATLIIYHVWDFQQPIPTSTPTFTPTSSITPIPSSTPIPSLTSKPLPTNTSRPSPSPVIVDGENWQVQILNMPDNLTLEFPAILQCRENKNSSEYVNDYLGALAVRVLSQDKWIESGRAEMILETSSGVELGRYEMRFNLAANEIGWIIPRTRPMDTGGSNPGIFKAIFTDIEWAPTLPDANQYYFDVNLIDQGIYGNQSFPQHRVTLQVNNIGDLEMNDVEFFGVVMDPQENAIEFLMSDDYDLPSGESKVFTLETYYSNRCVGFTPGKYRIHYWIDFRSVNDQVITKYYFTDIQQ